MAITATSSNSKAATSKGYSTTMTTAQVKAVQKAAGITQDGIYGKNTAAAVTKNATPAPTYTPTKNSSSSSSSSSSNKSTIMAEQTALNAKNAGKAGYVPLVVDGIVGEKTIAARSFVATPVATTPISASNLKVGSTGQAVIDLQKQLGITADGKFGPQTDAAVKAYQTTNNLTTDGIVGTNTAASMNKTTPTLPATTPIDMTVPTTTTPPVLPTPTTDPMQESYMKSLETQIANMQLQADTQRQQYLDQIQQDKQQAQDEINNLRDQQVGVINEQGATAIAEKEAKLVETQKEIARFDEAYKVKQGLTTQLQDMITQGNALILSQKSTTGLTAIRNPRVNETISNLSAAAAVLKIGIDAQDSNMTNVQNQLGTAVAAITSSYKDQLDYYTTLNTFYESSVTDAGNKLINLTAAEKDFMTSTMDTLQANIDRVQTNADKMQELFTDPSTATAFARAGITLLTPESEWGTKLAKQAYADELSLQSKEMASSGYTALIAGSAPAGADVVSITDSTGVTKKYWKKGEGTGSGGIVPTQTLQKGIDAGLSPEDAALDAAGYYESIGVPVDQKTLNAWIAEARNLTPKTEAPVVVPVKTPSAPVTAESAGKASAPVIKAAVNPMNSGIGVIGPKEMLDIATSIGNFFKGVTSEI